MSFNLFKNEQLSIGKRDAFKLELVDALVEATAK